MPKFIYTAKTSPIKIFRGEIEAESQQDALNKIHRMGYFPVSLEAKDNSSLDSLPSGFRKIPNKDIALFTRQLSTLIESGVNIINGLDIVTRQTGNRYLKGALTDISRRIKEGDSFSLSLSAYPKIFSNLYSSMIHAGEAGGNLEVSLKRLADFFEQEEELRNSIRAAMTYPAFIIVVSILTVIALLGFVIPRLVSMFEDMGQILPLPTKILINVSSFLRNWWWLLLAVILALAFIFKRISASAQGKAEVDRLKLKTPVLGEIILKAEIGRLMRTLSLLLSSGVPIVQSLDISTAILDNQNLRLEIDKFKGRISSGESLSRCLGDSRFFSGFVANIVNVAEETGTIEKSLLRIADEYEKDVDRSVKSLTRLLEPVIILVMGLVVGFIVLSMLLPIFQINLIVR